MTTPEPSNPQYSLREKNMNLQPAYMIFALKWKIQTWVCINDKKTCIYIIITEEFNLYAEDAIIVM